MSKVKIAVDAGHGSNTSGKRTAPFTENVDINGDGKADVKKGEQYKEHYANVMVAEKVAEKLLATGNFEVTRTGFDDADATDDVDTALSKRQRAIKAAGCILSVSIHFNACGNGKTFNSGEGLEVFIHDKHAKNSEALAKCVIKYLQQGTSQKNRGIKKSALSMCNCSTMGTDAAILCELAFMTNEREAQKLMVKEAFCEESAVEIVKGIHEYLGMNYTANTGTQQGTDASKTTTNTATKYKVQAGAFAKKANAKAELAKVKKVVADAYIITVGNLFKIQCGVFTQKANADTLVKTLKAANISAIVLT